MAYAEKRVSTAKGSKGKVSWRARYKRPDGVWGSEPGFPSKRLAEQWGEEQEAAIRKGTWIDPELMRKHFGVWAREFMKARPKRGRTNTRRWEYLEQYIFPQWQHTPLIAISWFDVESWSRTLPCDDVTIGHVVSFMSTVMTGAVDAKHLLVNPLFGRRRTEKKKPARPKKSAEDKVVPAEIVLQVADRLGPANGLAVIATAFLGPRLGELFGLHRDNALKTRRQQDDGGWFECPIIRIDPDVGELAEYDERDEEGNKLGTVLRLEPPKSEAGERGIDVPPFLALLLAIHKADWPHPILFCTPSGTFWRRNNWGRILRPAADGRPERKKRRGVSARAAWAPLMPGMTMRDLRHTHDSWQEQIGVKEPLAYESAGHKRKGIKAVYQHPTPEMRRERLDGLQQIYEDAMANLGWTTLWGRVDLAKRRPENDLPNIAQMISRGARGRRQALQKYRSVAG
ncbi:hypothetical protein ABZ883_04490 [Streptomyces sp. NPDC046977]|uniref:hypothetical protein n=1 Tax=Streptomyces sp. NPDC046977 TaxID=3154703 RepID=UPI0033FB44AE